MREPAPPLLEVKGLHVRVRYGLLWGEGDGVRPTGLQDEGGAGQVGDLVGSVHREEEVGAV